MKVLLSIKPEFANLIFSGEKKYEYRKQIFKKDVKTVVVYASSPVQKVIGEFSIDQIDYDNLEELWAKTEEHSGITFKYFTEYFINHDKGYAIKISKLKKYKSPFPLATIYNSTPPQSFAYID
jgi:predicted transcriptional regulator